ncbi:MAG: hypothetical protein ACREMW_09705 [Gemmatimonadales bacterium]
MTGNHRTAAFAWVTSPLFARQAVDFTLLWLVLKAANAMTAMKAGLPPLEFRPGVEAGALAFECVALLVFMRRAREDVLLANLGLGVPVVLLPFAVLHILLSGVAAL